jgi:hypothetical protein
VLQLSPFDSPGSHIDSLYVVAHNFNMSMSSIEYRIDYSPQLEFIFDLVGYTASIEGTSSAGIKISFSPPMEAGRTQLVEIVLFYWLCQGCIYTDVPVLVSPHPISGKIQAQRSPDGAMIEAVGMTSLVCPTIPVEDTSWGRIKALYK